MNVRLFLKRAFNVIILFVCICCNLQQASAQCATPINIFPYTEGFETGNGNWTTGGTASDWAWGSPTKPTINAAATGSKCWIVGGLTSSFYNNGERSWLQSPCFDFTSLQYPHISFNVFWETEQQFDGAGFQYSTDLGASWTNVGAISEPASCLNLAWFNFSPITNMSGLTTVRDGWSGTTQPTAGSCRGGNGSGGWINAQHTLTNLAGKPNVIFRFIFGAGTQCNGYDGFAVDDIVIGNAKPYDANFSKTCTSNNTVQFIASEPCPMGPTYNWDFGDPASGPTNNTSAIKIPTHTFSGPGTYSVTLTVSSPDNGSATSAPQTISILGFTPPLITNNNCAGNNNGSVTVNVIPATAGPFFYNWNTTPPQNTQTATGLGAGIYTVTVNALNSCQATATETITSPSALTHTPPSIIQPGCGLATGTATITETGGTGPYTYAWSPSGGNGPTASGLMPGNYTVTVTDSKNCSENIDINIATATPPGISVSKKKDASCLGSKDGSATVIVVGGMTTYSLTWNTTPVQTTATAINLGAGIYTVTATDNNNNGCSTSTSVQITEPLSGNCGDVFFPNAFTPNGDATNPYFGVLGNVAAISNYLLLVYNRYGELIFYTRDPLKRWDGFYKGKQLSGSFVWAATFMFKGNKRAEQGSVTIIR